MTNWSKEQPKEPGHYYIEPPDVQAVIAWYSPFQRVVMAGATRWDKYACKYGPRIPSPDELAAMERVIEDYRDHLDGNGLEYPDSVRVLDAIKGGEGNG